MRGRGKIVIPVRREVCQLGTLSYEIIFDIGRTNEFLHVTHAYPCSKDPSSKPFPPVAPQKRGCVPLSLIHISEPTRPY